MIEAQPVSRHLGGGTMSTPTLDDIPTRAPTPRPPTSRRPVALLVAGAVLAVAVGSGLALTRGGRPAGDGAAATQPTTAVAGQPAPDGATPDARGPADDPTPPRDPAQPDAARAVATARDFLARELGMTDLVALPFRAVDARTGEVGFRHKYGEGRRLLPATAPTMVTVRLYRLPAGWWVLGVRGRSIQVDQPVRLQHVSSPLTVAGRADVYEATVSWKVTQDQPGRDLVLGQGFLTGLGGKVSFRQPTSAAAGWAIFYEESNDGSGRILQATAVRVRFAADARRPRITALTFEPQPRSVGGGWLELPAGAGTLVVSVDATDAQQVRLVLTPTGTGTAPLTRVLATDTDPRDGFRLTWRYPADPLTAHLGVQATGAGGTAERTFEVVHAEP
jgi:hypothetical protein